MEGRPDLAGKETLVQQGVDGTMGIFAALKVSGDNSVAANG
jgi:hypothetical protein